MPGNNDGINRDQLTATVFVGLLSPMVHDIPAAVSDAAGRGGWASVLLAAVPALAYALCYAALRRGAGSLGGDELVISAVGRPAGRLLLGLIGLWLVFYGGLLLSMGAALLVSTVFLNVTPVFFIVVMLLMCLVAALGRLSAIARSAMVFRPWLLLVFIIIFAFALPNTDINELLPVSRSDILPVLRGGGAALNTLSVAVYFTFLEGQVRERFSLRRFLPWLAALLIIAFLMCAVTLGTLGEKLAESLILPFFAAIRTVSLFNVFEHIEAFVMALWVFADFIMISSLFKIASRLLARALGLDAPSADGRFFDLRRGRWLVWLCVLCAGALALVLATRPEAILSVTRSPVYNVHSLLAAALVPVCLVILRIKARGRGRFRGR